MPKQSFDSWKAKVNLHIVLQCGMEADDLPDYDYYSDYEMGASPKDVAHDAIAAAREM